MKLKECFFFQDCIRYFGHVIQRARPGISTKATDEISGLQHITKVTELKSFLGLCNVFRRFVPNFARVAALLRRRMEKNKSYHFGRLNETAVETMETVKHRLLSLLILSPPRPDGRYTFDTDAHDKKFEVVLRQEQPEGAAKPIELLSRLASKAEQAYNTAFRDCLAVMWAILLLRLISKDLSLLSERVMTRFDRY